MRTYSRRGRLPREETQSCGDVGAAKNTAAPARMIFRPRTARAARGLPHDYLPRRQPGRIFFALQEIFFQIGKNKGQNYIILSLTLN